MENASYNKERLTNCSHYKEKSLECLQSFVQIMDAWCIFISSQLPIYTEVNNTVEY